MSTCGAKISLFDRAHSFFLGFDMRRQSKFSPNSPPLLKKELMVCYPCYLDEKTKSEYKTRFTLDLSEFDIIGQSRGGWHAYDIRIPAGPNYTFQYETAVQSHAVGSIVCRSKKNPSLIWSFCSEARPYKFKNHEFTQISREFSRYAEDAKLRKARFQHLINHKYSESVVSIILSFLEYPHYSTYCGN